MQWRPPILIPVVEQYLFTRRVPIDMPLIASVIGPYHDYQVNTNRTEYHCWRGSRESENTS